jgi:tyrosyl-tRNA synthetase
MLFEELSWRGLVEQTTDRAELERAIESKNLRVYIGFDPTAPSLHHGNLVQLILLRHFQNYGIQPFCVAGGSTGLIGDPRQSGERKLNDRETVSLWLEKLQMQFRKFLDFNPDNPHAAVILNNFDWTNDLNVLDFLRETGKHFRVNQMLAKETVAARMESGEGLSFAEFSYQILQAWDFLVLHRDYGVDLQCGGNDQWGNLTAGVDLVRKVTGHSVHALTTPIIAKADGTKFGKTEGGAIWLDPELMSPYSFYQFWLNVDDADVIKLLKVFTFLSRSEIEQLGEAHQADPAARLAQRVLAEQVTEFVHSADAVSAAKNVSQVLFAKSDPRALSEITLTEIAAEIGQTPVRLNQLWSEIFVAAGLTSSLGDFRRNIQSKGLSVNNRPLTESDQTLNSADLLSGGFVLLKKGKKQYGLGKV